MTVFKDERTGKWYYRVRYKAGAVWKEKKKRGFKTKREASNAENRMKERIYRNEYGGEDIKLLDFYDEFVENYKSKLAPATLKLYSYAREVLEDFYGNVYLKEIDTSSYQRLINELSSNYELETVKTRHKKIRAMFNKACALKYISNNPTTGVELSGKAKKKVDKVQYLFSENLAKLLQDALQSKSDSARVVYVAAMTGLRLSELLGLTWDDVHFKKRTLTVRKTYDYKLKRFASTKNENSKRTITLDSFTLQYLIDYKKEQEAAFQDWEADNPDNSVFWKMSKARLTPEGIYKYLKQACKRADIPRITPHGLRHTHVVSLIEAKADIKYISTRLGHSDITTTLNFYTHISKELEAQNAKSIEDFYAQLHDKIGHKLATKKEKTT
ncbi:site-specific integrase [Listeria booriae]|uniref:Site-specific integrase n=1 Tax=Listeria booriae TaxID=1552123 RepID=A0A842AG89_9LIST|nr:tyrosine-type recombinase/integrase [Listeria booriae]MBC1616387.1 site-specific integrase [Listeria booriae]